MSFGEINISAKLASEDEARLDCTFTYDGENAKSFGANFSLLQVDLLLNFIVENLRPELLILKDKVSSVSQEPDSTISLEVE
tara:strand:+ start:1299 stop:1544 length:246 start_codon:yes stop_codon:yes gene_type:complete